MMDIKVGNGANYTPALRSGAWAKTPAGPKENSPQTDRVEISAGAREKQEAAGAEDRFSQMEALLEGPAKDALVAQVQQWRQEHRLEANWNAAVDPDGSIYARSYMESLAGQSAKLRTAIEDYYQEEHQENLRFSNPYNHLIEKYKYSGSPYFRGDLPEAQRNMAFRQEEALLRGGRVALNDPWALASIGGVPKGADMEQAARDYAQSVLDGLIADYKKLHGIEE